MTQDEYDEKKRVLQKEYDVKVGELAQAYSFQNSTAKVGDIIKGRSGAIIEIDKKKWTFTFSRNYPECIYYGVRLRKDLAPFKSGERDSVYESSIIKTEKEGN